MDDTLNTKVCNIVCKNKKRITIDFDGIYISVKPENKILGDNVTISYCGDVHNESFKIVSVY